MYFTVTLGKLVVYKGILLFISSSYEKTSIGYYGLNSSLGTYVSFSTIQMEDNFGISQSNPYNCIFPHSCPYVFNNEFDIRIHAFSSYRK